MALANDAVSITPGAGAVIAAQTANGKEHQVVILADQNGNLDPLSRPATLVVTATAAAGSAVTATLPSVVGQFHYVTALTIVAYTTATRVGSATPVVVTTTNIPGSLAFTFATAGAVGATDIQQPDLAAGLRASVAATATTVVAPATPSVIWRVTVYYYTAAS